MELRRGGGEEEGCCLIATGMNTSHIYLVSPASKNCLSKKKTVSLWATASHGSGGGLGNGGDEDDICDDNYYYY